MTLEDGTKRRCILSHYFIPMYNGHRYQAIHLHGHSHFTDEADIEIDIAERLNKQGFHTEIYNVGCMYWNYEPVTLDEIIAHGKTVRPNYGILRKRGVNSRDASCEQRRKEKFTFLWNSSIMIGNSIE